jgi:hypothetical protein
MARFVESHAGFFLCGAHPEQVAALPALRGAANPGPLPASN